MAKVRVIRKERPLIIAVEQSALAQRMDPAFWNPKYEEILERLASGPYGQSLRPVRTLLDQSGIAQGPKGKSAYVAKGLPFVRISNIKHTGVDMVEGVKYVQEGGPMDPPNGRPKPGFVLLVRTGATIGKVAIWLEDYPPAAVSSVIYRLRFMGVNPFFACTFLKSLYGQSQLERLKNGPAVENLNLEEVGSIQMVVPPPELQMEVETQYREMSHHHLSSQKAASEGRRIDSDNELKIARLKLDDLLARFTEHLAGTRPKL